MSFIHQNPPLYTVVQKDVTGRWKRALIIGWHISSEGQVAEPVVFHPDYDLALTYERINSYGDSRFTFLGCYASQLEANEVIKEMNGS